MSTTNNITETQAAAYLSISPRTLQQWRYLKRGPSYIRISNRCIRYRMSDLRDWLAQHRVDPSTDA